MNKLAISALSAVGVAMLAGHARGGGGATIEWIPAVAPTVLWTHATDVSANGRRVCGHLVREESPSHYEAIPVVWDRDQGMIELPRPHGKGQAWATSISDNGRTVVGVGEPHGWQVGVVWTCSDDGSIVTEITEPAAVWGTNRDGSFRVGCIADSSTPAKWDPLLWTASGATIILPTPIGSEIGGAIAVANDGTAVGWAQGKDFLVALRWRTADTYEVLDYTANLGPEWVSREARLISPTGDYIAGAGISPRWTDELGWHGSVHDNQPPELLPNGMTPDGNLIVGALDDYETHCESSVYGFSLAMIWDPYNGTRLLREVLEAEFGLVTSCLSAATGVSSDGRTIVGNGIGPHGVTQAFILTLPPPCTADTNADNLVDGRDLSLILSAFGRQTPPGLGPDLNDDGRVNGSDLSILLFNFGDPC